MCGTHMDIKKLEKVQNRPLKFIFKLKGHVSFSQIKQDTSITSLKDRRKKLRHNIFVKLIRSGVVDDRHSNSPETAYDTSQQGGLYAPFIRTTTPSCC